VTNTGAMSVLAAAFFLLAPLTSDAFGEESAGYRIPALSINGGGRDSGSTNYRNLTSLSGPVATGASASADYINHTGFLYVASIPENSGLALPSVTAWPTAGGITYGQALSSSTLSGGSASTAGSFAFTVPATVPNAGTYRTAVTFTPTDLTHYSSVSGSVDVAVARADQTITFGVLPLKIYGDGDFDPNAAASSGLQVSYSSSNTEVAAIVNGKIHIVGTGISTITAAQAGDSNHNAAPDAARALTVYESYPNSHSLTVNASGNGRGSVNGGGTYYSGTSHDVTAAAAPGSAFTGWSGDCSGQASPYSVTMPDRDASCTANFARSAYFISFSLYGSGVMTCSSSEVAPNGVFQCSVTVPPGHHLKSVLDNSSDVTASLLNGVYPVSNVNEDHVIAATTELNPFVLRLTGNAPPYPESWHQLLQEAYDAASNADDILIRTGDLYESLLFDRPISLHIAGGCDVEFKSLTGFTTIHGSVTIAKGLVVIDGIIIE